MIFQQYLIQYYTTDRINNDIKRASISYQANKENELKQFREYYRNLSWEKRKKKSNYANIKNKYISDTDRKRTNKYLKYYWYGIKNLLNHLIKCVEKIESVYCNK